MCYTGKCLYEDHEGDCIIQPIRDNEDYPEDARCMLEEPIMKGNRLAVSLQAVFPHVNAFWRDVKEAGNSCEIELMIEMLSRLQDAEKRRKYHEREKT